MATVVDATEQGRADAGPTPLDYASKYRGALAGVATAIVLAITTYSQREAIGNLLPNVHVWLALVPALFILHQAVFLRLYRRQQFVTALGDDVRWEQVADSYFGGWALAVRYFIPSVLATLLCWSALAVLADPPAAVTTDAARDGVGGFRWLLGTSAAEMDPILRGARFGLAGAYLYTIILLAQRGFRRDITSGVAMWAAAMFVLGPLSGALAALLISSGVSGGSDASFVRDTVFVFAGMLPREFSQYIQNSARRMLQPAAAALALRNMPLSMLRGATPSVEDRFAEEGIEDVAALAYASPFQLIRATSYDTRQIVQWIDESLLIATVPDVWQDLEKAGITGAIDLAWCRDKPPVLNKLAEQAKMDVILLGAVTERLDEDAQVADLRRFYWTEVSPTSRTAAAASTTLVSSASTTTLVSQTTSMVDPEPAISVSFEMDPEASVEDQDRVAQAIAAGAAIEKQGSVVTLNNVPARRWEELRAALSIEPTVKRDSVRRVPE